MTGFPRFYDPNRIGTLFYPDVARIAHEGAEAGLSRASADEHKTHLVLIDMQVDFCHEGGAVYVPGAQGDIRRTIEFIYRNAGVITQITCSLDSHVPRQIFSPAWWVDAAGNHPAPFTVISAEEVDQERWRPLMEPAWSVRYVHTLEEKAKKQLTIWPYHALIGGTGHAIDPELWSAVFWHSIARNTQPLWLTKGSVPLTEHYSIFQPEVPVPGHPDAAKAQSLFDLLEEAALIVIAGEAESHCVLETVEDLVEEFGHRPAVLSKVRFLRDCTSPVKHPEIDFHAMAQERFIDFAGQGVRFVDSTEDRDLGPIPLHWYVGGQWSMETTGEEP